MKKYSWLILIIVLLTACNGSNPTPAPVDTGPRPTPTVEVVPPNPTPSPDAYPAAPAPTPLPDNYPPPPPAPPTSPYPTGEFVWLLLPVGTQGEEAKTYDNLQTAVQALTSAGAAVKTAEMTELVVCAALGCPTSAHYRVEIDVAGLETAVSLGWVEE